MRFGAVILGFMGGCLWGFASSQPGGPAPALLAASIVPAFLAFVSLRETPAASCLWLAFGFVALQAIDVLLPTGGRRSRLLAGASAAADGGGARLPADRRAPCLNSSPTPTGPVPGTPARAAGARCWSPRSGDRVVRERALSGGEALTTNNRMELMAAIAALEALDRPTRAHRRHRQRLPARRRDALDPRLEGATAGAPPTGKPVKNEDLWRRLDAAAARHAVAWDWVKGHAGHPENERADALARAGMAPFKPAVVKTPISCPDDPP